MRLISFLLLSSLAFNAFAQASGCWTIAGTVKDETGAPVAGVPVNFDLQGFTEKKVYISAISTITADEQGSFTLGACNGMSGVVSATKLGYVLDYKPVIDKVTTIDLVLKRRGRRLAGYVVDEAGNPVPNAVLGIKAFSKEWNYRTNSCWILGLNGSDKMQVSAGPNGYFVADHLPSLKLHVVAVAGSDWSKLVEPESSSSKPVPKTFSVDLSNGDVLNYRAIIQSTEPVKPAVKHTPAVPTKGGTVIRRVVPIRKKK